MNGLYMCLRNNHPLKRGGLLTDQASYATYTEDLLRNRYITFVVLIEIDIDHGVLAATAIVFALLFTIQSSSWLYVNALAFKVFTI